METIFSHIRLFCLTLSISLFPVLGFGQKKVPAFHPEKNLEEFTVDQWTGETGLNSNNLTSVFFANDGFLWVTTYNGLMRFDGLSFDIYTKENIPFIMTDSFNKVFDDGEGGYFFSTQGSGIVHYSEGQFSSYLGDDPLLPKAIRTLWMESIGKIWVGSNNYGLYLIEDGVAKKIDHPAVNDVSIMGIDGNDKGEVWVATNGNGLVKLVDAEVKEVYTIANGLQSNVVNTVRLLSDGQVAVGSTKGFSIGKNGSFRVKFENWNMHVNYILEDHFGSIWICTERGLIRYNAAKGRSDLVGKRSGLEGVEISSIAFDREEGLWISTSKKGLFRIKETGLYTLDSRIGLSNDLTNIVFEDRNGRILTGSDAGEVDVYIEDRFEKLALSKPPINQRIRDIAEEEDGTLWIGSYNGLLRKKGSEEKEFTIENGLPAQDIRRILYVGNGHLWVATRSGGIFKMKNEVVTKVFDKQNGLLSNYVLALEIDAQGNLYLGTNGGGLSVISAKGQIVNHAITEDDSGFLIFNIDIDQEGNVWLVSNTGLFHFDGQNFRGLNLQRGLKGESLFDWVEDHIGNVWITSNKGVLRMRKTDIIKHLDGVIKEIPFQLYDTEDGMKEKECTGATRATLTSDGSIFIPTIGGIVRVRPDDLYFNILAPNVHITSFSTDEETWSTFEYANVPPGKLRYEFSFTALSLRAPAKNAYKYFLEGFDKEWNEAGDRREAIYTNLPPGEYTFRVIAANNDGIWNMEGATYSFEIKPFFYQTTIFYVFLLVLTGLAIYGTFRWRLSVVTMQNDQLKKLNTELDRFVYSASHDLRAPLASILGLVTLSRIEKENKDHYLDLIEKSAKRLDSFIKDIIDFSRNARLELSSKPIDFKEIIQNIFQEASFLYYENKIKFELNIEGQGEFSSDQVRVEIILNNLIANAVKHHNPKQESPIVSVEVKYDHEKATIWVKDNGSGIGEEHQNEIFKMFYRANPDSKGSGLGLYIVHETLQKIGGEISFESEIGKGSTFIVSLPCIKMES